MLPALLAPALLGPGTARAEAWPERPIRLIYPFGGGAPTETLARMVAEQLRLALGVPIVFDNRPGAGGLIAAEATARAPKDGHTLGWLTSSILTINPNIYLSLPYRLEDFAPLSVTYRGPLVLAAANTLPGGDLRGTIAALRAQRGMAYATAGIATSPHLMMEMFQGETGVELAHLPFRGEQPIVTELLAGRVLLFAGSLATLLPHLDSGAFRVLAISTPERLATAPKIPTFVEQGMAGFVWRYWHGMVAPAGTPEPVLQRLERGADAGDPQRPGAGARHGGHAGGTHHAGGIRRTDRARPRYLRPAGPQPRHHAELEQIAGRPERPDA